MSDLCIVNTISVEYIIYIWVVYYLCYILFLFFYLLIYIISFYRQLIIYCRMISTAVELHVGLYFNVYLFNSLFGTIFIFIFCNFSYLIDRYIYFLHTFLALCINSPPTLFSVILIGYW